MIIITLLDDEVDACLMNLSKLFYMTCDIPKMMIFIVIIVNMGVFERK